MSLDLDAVPQQFNPSRVHRAAATIPANVSFADAITAVSGWFHLSYERRRDLRSALKRVAELIGVAPADLPFDPRTFKDRFYKINRVGLTMKDRGFANLACNVAFTMEQLGLTAPRRSKGGLPPAWTKLLEALEHPPRRAALRAFAAWATDHDLLPRAIVPQSLEDYAAWRGEATLAWSRSDIRRTVAAAWNAAVASDVDPLLEPLVIPKRRVPYVLDDDAFRKSLITAREAWLERSRPRQGLAHFALSTGPKKPWSPATENVRRFACRQAASILVHLGHPAESLSSLKDLVEPIDRPLAIVDWLHDRDRARASAKGEEFNEQQPGAQVGVVAETLRQIAKYGASSPSEIVTALGMIVSRSQERARDGLTLKNEVRLRALIQKIPYALMLNLPKELMLQARAEKTSAEDAERLARLALAVAILLACPMRLDNLRSLRLDRHLLRMDVRDPLRITHIVIGKSETKNRKRLEWPVSDRLAAFFASYLRDFRPQRAGSTCAFLFPGQDGLAAMSPHGLASGIVNVVKKNVGVDINVHLLRHFAAWLYLRKHPGRLDDVRRILGHKSLQTTDRFYVAFQDIAAAERFDETVLGEEQRTEMTALAVWHPVCSAAGKPNGGSSR